MKRFIFLTFGFLGVAFYELSGGSAFDPVEAREMVVAMRDQTEISDQADVLVASAESITTEEIAPAETVSRAAINLVALETTIEESVAAEPADNTMIGGATLAESATPQPIPAAMTEPQPQVRLIGVASLKPEADDISFAGLSTVAASENVAAPKDIRAVTGSVVNMRSGPGTNFGVVGQLSRDTKVEVIQDGGNGWVELRPLDGGQSGWMADFLLSKS